MCLRAAMAEGMVEVTIVDVDVVMTVAAEKRRQGRSGASVVARRGIDTITLQNDGNLRAG